MKTTNNLLFTLIGVLFIISFSGCNNQPASDGDNKILPVPFTSVKVTDDLWAPRIKRNHEVTIPIAFGQSEKTGRIRNFKIAGGLEEGKFQSKYPFDDSDVFKIIEGASYSLQTFPDPALEAYLDTLIYYIGLAQEDDGYIYTYRTIMGDDSHPWIGTKRWEKTHILSHELYNIGHMYEAAVAHYQATGKRTFLDIAIKSADLVARDFGWGKIENYPGHQEIEIGLVKLYRVTGNSKYLDLAKFFLDVRNNGEEYNQAHKKVTEQTIAVGHAVRAAYMYTGMADVATLTNDSGYVNAIDKIWQDVVYKKLYLTGGIGATGGNEGFGKPYDLPNMSAYCETCASIANVFWNYRMFLLHGNSKYYDILERTLYNGLLSGVSLSGDHFFYPNPLASSGQHKRQEWFGCACCPSNLCRFIPSVPGYVYAKTRNRLYVNLYMDNTAKIELDGKTVEVIQQTKYPWDGKVEITITPDFPSKFTLCLRVPGWAQNEAVPGDLYHYLNNNKNEIVLKINGKAKEYSPDEGYLIINRKWKKGDIVELDMPMPVRKVIAHKNVEADIDKVAIQKGPIVFCAEGIDQKDNHVLNLVYDPETPLESEYRPNLLNGVQVITGEATGTSKQLLTLIPYHVWANRGPGEMMVWLPTTKEVSRPLPAPAIPSKSK
ncbi:MAG: glycoside hydrolase family 127 protein [Bacteroidales bacterium]|nr:glycoside hydrolase family 127 protein [Bacteroidales bacterium]